MSQSQSPPQPAPKGRLVSVFEDRPIEDHGSAWASLWDSNESGLWDRGKPSPALIDVIEERQDLFSPFADCGRRKRALVPGCGRGYDVVLLALHGFDAYGLEISPTAVAAAEAYAADELRNPSPYNFGKMGQLSNDQGKVKFIQGDFFQFDLEKDAENAAPNAAKFDLIYDYTFLCALHPSMREQWAKRIAELLNPGGLLVCLEFPMYKDLKLPGPPWGLKGVYWDLLARGGNGLLGGDASSRTDGQEKQHLKGQFSRVLYVQPARTYEVGKGTDMLSVYARNHCHKI